MKNKKGGERVLSIYLFIIYIIVAVGIVSGVIIFYGKPLDVRSLEAEILTDKVIDCLVEQGELKSEVGDSFDLLKNCKFDFKDNTRKYEGDERYAVKVELYDFNTGGLIKPLPIAGDISFFEFCNMEGDKIPRCNEKQVYVLEGENKILLKINSAVGKVENA